MNGKKPIRKTVKKRTYPKYSKKTVRPTKNFTKAVKQVINRVAEMKATPYDELDYSLSTNSGFSTPVNLSDCFNIAQGTGDGQRIGNTIDCKKAILNLVLRRNNLATPNLPCEVFVYIGYLKGNRGTAPSATPFANFYQDGNSAKAWNGTALRTLRMVNKDIFIITNRFVQKIGSSASTTAQFANNDYPLLIRKKINLKALLGKVKYQYDNVNDAEHDKDLFMWVSWVNIDDSIDASLFPIDMSYFVDMNYQDV